MRALSFHIQVGEGVATTRTHFVTATMAVEDGERDLTFRTSDLPALHEVVERLCAVIEHLSDEVAAPNPV